MYDPFALERIRIDEAALRRQVAKAPRRPTRRAATDTAAEIVGLPRLRSTFAGALHRGRSSEPCTDC